MRYDPWEVVIIGTNFVPDKLSLNFCKYSLIIHIIMTTSRLKGERWIYVGKRIRQIRKFRDIPLKKLTELLGLNSTAVYLGYEVGKSYWTPEMLVKIANYLDVTLELLIDSSKEVTIEDLLKNSRKIMVNDLGKVNIILDFVENINLVDEKVVEIVTDILQKNLPKNIDEDLPLALKVVRNKPAASNVEKKNNTDPNNVENDNITNFDDILEKQLLDEINSALKDPLRRKKTVKKVSRFYDMIRKINKVDGKERILEEVEKSAG